MRIPSWSILQQVCLFSFLTFKFELTNLGNLCLLAIQFQVHGLSPGSEKHAKRVGLVEAYLFSDSFCLLFETTLHLFAL